MSLRRRKPLKRGNSQMKRTELKRGTRRLARVPMMKQSAKNKERHAAGGDYDLAKRLMRLRSGGRCEVVFSTRCAGVGEHPHHVLPSGRGGLDVVENLLDSCWICHRELHDNPAEAKRRGVLK